MTDGPTGEQIAKLPKWAQEYIADISRERYVAVRALNEYCDDSTPSPFSVEELLCVGNGAGPSSKLRYIQAHTIDVRWRGVRLSVSAHNYSNTGTGIRLRWRTDDRAEREVAMIPESYQCVRLVAKEELS